MAFPDNNTVMQLFIKIKNYKLAECFIIYIFEPSSTMKIGVERVNQVSKLTRIEVNNIVDVAVNCVQIVEQILR